MFGIAMRGVVVGGLLLGGCAENAILELQVELPAAPPDDGTGRPWFAQVQVRDSSQALALPWSSRRDLEPLELGSAPRWDCSSIQSFDEGIDLHLRVRFCRSPDGLEAPGDARMERWYRLDHPFYIGRRTYWQTRIHEVPECMSDGDCANDPEIGPVGVCTDGVCGCVVSDECPGSMTCEPDEETGLGNCLLDVDRCEIEGCVNDVGRRSETFCSVTGEHLCERYSNLESSSAYACD